MKNSISKRVLVIAPHQDDEIIGCGGFICFARDQGWEVQVVHVFAGTSGIPAEGDTAKCAAIRHDEARKSARLGDYTLLPNIGLTDRDRSGDQELQRALIALIRAQKPDIVLLPHEGETDFEHRLVSVAGKEASWLSATTIFPELGERLSEKAAVLYYEVWRNIDAPSLILPIDRYVAKKRQMLLAFSSQMQDSGWVEGSIGRNAYRGVTLNGSGYVEAFACEPLNVESIEL